MDTLTDTTDMRGPCKKRKTKKVGRLLDCCHSITSGTGWHELFKPHGSGVTSMQPTYIGRQQMCADTNKPLHCW